MTTQYATYQTNYDFSAKTPLVIPGFSGPKKQYKLLITIVEDEDVDNEPVFRRQPRERVLASMQKNAIQNKLLLEKYGNIWR